MGLTSKKKDKKKRQKQTQNGKIAECVKGDGREEEGLIFFYSLNFFLRFTKI